MLKAIKIRTIAPTRFGSRRNHHQGAISCLAKTRIVVLLCSSLMKWSMLWRHTSCNKRVLFCKHVVHGRGFLYRVPHACRARSEPSGTRWRTGGEVKGKLANGVGSQYSHATSERGISSIAKADAHTSAASSRLNWRPHLFKWIRPFRGKTKSGFCACAIMFRTSYTTGWYAAITLTTSLTTST